MILHDLASLLGDIAQLIGIFVEIVIALIVLFILLRWVNRHFSVKLVRKTELTRFASNIVEQGFGIHWQGITFGKYGFGILYFEKDEKHKMPHPFVPTEGSD